MRINEKIIDDYYKKVDSFLQEYLIIDEKAYDFNGRLRDSVIRESMALLLNNGVFSSVSELRMEALETYNIVLQYWMFDSVNQK